VWWRHGSALHHFLEYNSVSGTIQSVLLLERNDLEITHGKCALLKISPLAWPCFRSLYVGCGQNTFSWCNFGDIEERYTVLGVEFAGLYAALSHNITDLQRTGGLVLATLVRIR
jgi:hypothetical protein